MKIITSLSPFEWSMIIGDRLAVTAKMSQVNGRIKAITVSR